MTEAVHSIVVAGIFWAVLCRACAMDDFTPTTLKVRYGALLVGAATSLPIYTSAELGQVLLGGSVLLYLWLDARRWRHGVPR